MTNDNINHPKHYTCSAAKCSTCNAIIECIDVTRHHEFNIGNSIKYLWRYKYKNGIEDLQKAIWYINDEIEKMNCLDIPTPKTDLKIYPPGILLRTEKDVMEAFLRRHKLINSSYFDLTGEIYLYLDENGTICEEDGAATKSKHVPICMLDDTIWWKILE